MTETTDAESLQDLRASVEHFNFETTQMAATHNDQIDPLDDGDDDFWCEDGGLGDVSNDGFTHASMLNREWKRRHDQFHTMGYRDGITAGKEATAQEGFNVGFKESSHVGYKWGLVRGISSTLASLPDQLKEQLMGTLESRNRLQGVHESARAISTNDALRMFYVNIKQPTTKQPRNHPEQNSDEVTGCNKLETLSKELASLLHEAPEIKVNSELN